MTTRKNAGVKRSLNFGLSTTSASCCSPRWGPLVIVTRNVTATTFEPNDCPPQNCGLPPIEVRPSVASQNATGCAASASTYRNRPPRSSFHCAAASRQCCTHASCVVSPHEVWCVPSAKNRQSKTTSGVAQCTSGVAGHLVLASDRNANASPGSAGHCAAAAAARPTTIASASAIVTDARRTGGGTPTACIG